MNIDGLGERIIEDFYNFGYVKNIPGIYNLYKHKEELMELEGFGEKSINNLLEAIENSKNNSLERLLFGLGIRHFGEKSAKVLAENYPDIDLLKDAKYEDLININDIGTIMAKSIVEYFQDTHNLELIETLKDLGINTKYLQESKKYNEVFTDKKFVLTGTISFISREELKNKITSYGGIVVESVSKKTDIIIVGEAPGSKYDKAKELKITIWNEEELKNNLDLLK